MGFSVANFMLDYYEGFGNLPDFVTSEIDDLTQIADADLTIDSKVDDNKYGSSCVNYYDDYQVWCYVSVCDEDGCMWDRVDECLLPGEAGVEYPERCYMEPGPVCDLKGMCDDSRYDLKPEPNPDGNTCYYDINCGNNGWDYLTHDKPDTNNVINGDCHYDIACDEDEGWDYQSVDDEGDKPDCDDDEDAECTDSGWECN